MTPKDSKQLMIALEPEAASLFCRRLDLTQFQCDQSDISFTPGTKYLVIDAGGELCLYYPIQNSKTWPTSIPQPIT